MAFCCAVLLFLHGAAAPRAEGAGGVHHLLDATSEQTTHGFVIEGTHMPILDPYEAEHTIALPNPSAYGTLLFSTGLQPFEGGGTVRFEVLLRAESEEPVSLFQNERSEPGWVNVRVDLPETKGTALQLIFRKSAVEGGVGRVILSAFGDPALVPRTIAKRPSVVLVSIDTLRPDHLGAYGYEAARTPALDKLAREGVLFENVYSTSTWTLPAHASLLRGVYTATLPSTRNEASPDKPLLAEQLRAAGYRTAAFTGGGYMGGMFKLDRGFGTYFAFEQPAPADCGPGRFDGETVFARASKWLSENSGLPFFLFLHTYDVHDRCPVVPETELSKFRGRWDPGKDGRQKVLRYYDDLIAETDRRFGAFMNEIERLGIADSTLVAVTSDHGEALWEHGIYGHGCEKKPYRELARVPLILRLPGVVPAGHRIDEPVSLVDVVPTVLDLVGLPLPSAVEGRKLPMQPGRESTARSVFVHCDDLLAVRFGRHRLLTSKSGAFPDEIYDIERDPGEKRNLAGKDPALDAELRALAADYWRRARPDAGAESTRLEEIDEKTRERLRVLGYIE